MDNKEKLSMKISKVSEKGSVVIPADYRKKFNINHNDDIMFLINDNGDICIEKFDRQDFVTFLNNKNNSNNNQQREKEDRSDEEKP